MSSHIVPRHTATPLVARPQVETAEAPHVSPFNLFGALKRHPIILAVGTLVVVVPAASYILSIKPYYNATSVLMVGTRHAAFQDQQADVASQIDMQSVNTQVDVLKYPIIGERVAAQLDLAHDPEFESALTSVSFKARVTAFFQRLTGTVPPPAKPMTHEQLLQALSSILASKLTILNDAKSYLITITAKTGDPERSARIVNAYAATYLEVRREAKIDSIRRANSVLEDQIEPLRQRLRHAEEAVEAFREKNGLAMSQLREMPGAGGGSSTLVDQQLSQMNQQLGVAQGQLVEANARMAEINAALRSGSIESIPAALTSTLVQQLQAQETEVRARIAALSRTYLEGNPELQAAQAQAARIHAEIGREVASIAAGARHDMASAQAQVDSLTHQVMTLQGRVTGENQADVSLRQLESDVATSRAIYQDYLGRLAQTSSEVALQEPEAELIARADVPLGASGPPRAQLLIIALLLGLGVGVGAAVMRERMKRGISSLAQLESVSGVFGLGIVSNFSGQLATQYRPGANTIYADTVSSVRSLLYFGQDQFRANVVTVTSAEPREGKTSFALSLAAATGRDGGRALVIDCDARNAAPARLAAVSANSGRQEVGFPGSRFATKRRDVLPGVDVLAFTAGEEGASLVGHLAELRDVIAKSRAEYDMIVLDTPPILAFPDAAVLSHETDGVVLVVRWQSTSSGAVSQAVRALATYDARILGAVLTQVRLEDLSGAEAGRLRVYRQYGRARA